MVGAVMLLSACSRGNDVEHIKKSHLTVNPAQTIGHALAHYSYFTSGKWEAYTKEGARFVRFTGSLDIAYKLTASYYAKLKKEKNPDRAVAGVDVIITFALFDHGKFTLDSVAYNYARKDGSKSMVPEETSVVINAVYNNVKMPLP